MTHILNGDLFSDQPGTSLLDASLDILDEDVTVDATLDVFEDDVIAELDVDITVGDITIGDGGDGPDLNENDGLAGAGDNGVGGGLELGVNVVVLDITDELIATPIPSLGGVGLPDLSTIFDPSNANGLADMVNADDAFVALDPLFVTAMSVIGENATMADLPSISLGLGEDKTVIGSFGDDVVTGGAGDDAMWGLNGDDIMRAGGGSDLMFGGNGDDTYVLGSENDMASEEADAGFDTILAGFDIDLNDFGDNIEGLGLIGDDNANLTGNDGDNLQIGNAGNNKLWGQGGADTLFGGDGNDLLDGGTGTDHMSGGLGNDVYVVDDATDKVVDEVAFSLGGGVDTVRAFVDNYALGENLEILRLGTIETTDAWSGMGNDALNTLVGNAGNNTLNGRGSNDQINGNDGDDVLIGGEGADTLVGGSGADTFVYSSISNSRAGTENRDVINGFAHGVDAIELSAIDADTTSFGRDDAFNFIGTNGFDGTAGQLRTQSLGDINAILVEADINGDANADFHIVVLGTTWMEADDFIL